MSSSQQQPLLHVLDNLREFLSLPGLERSSLDPQSPSSESRKEVLLATLREFADASLHYVSQLSAAMSSISSSSDEAGVSSLRERANSIIIQQQQQQPTLTIDTKSMALDSEVKRTAMQDSTWADGLRGVASIYVVASHLVLCFARALVLPCCASDQTTTPLLFQRPIFRLVAQGHSWVSIFFILLGFVNALKPIKLARSGQVETALTNLATSSFRRTFRLVLPATAATIISWMACQLGMYESARIGDAYWLYSYTPMESLSWGTAIEDLVQAIKSTWQFTGTNQYDQPQWALIYLLQGSMLVFGSLLMTVNLTSVWRSVSIMGFAVWSLNWSRVFHDPILGFTIFGGICLAELSVSDIPLRLSRFSPLLTPPLMIIALVLMSYPSDFADRAPWSLAMKEWGTEHLPSAFQFELHRGYGSIGGLILVFAILISPHVRGLLSRRPLIWLGKVSFPIYLLHGTFLRSIFSWIVFTSEIRPTEIDLADGKKIMVERYAMGGNLRIAFAVVVSMGLMLVACHYWAKKVEPVFARITKRAEDIMTGRGSDHHAPLSGLGRPVLPVRKE